MSKFFTAFFFLFISFASYAQQPDSLVGPRVWLKADKSALTNNRWSDVSFFKNDALATSATEIPSAAGTLNFNKSIVFDGIDDYFKIPYSLEGIAELSVLAVFQSADTTERGIWGVEQATTRNVFLTTRQAMGPDTVLDRYGKYEKVVALHSILQTWNKTIGASSSTAFMALGSAGKTKTYKPFKGVFSELIVFNRALSFLERIQYETYLAIKYGTGLHEGNFVSSAEKVLWDSEKNSSYGNHIAGIGRDDFFGLYQKQSGSSFDSSLLIITAGRMATSNEENNAAIANQDFILWGDNGLPLSSKRGSGSDSVLSIVQRKWALNRTGATANRLPTELHIDATKFGANSSGYWLVIDRSGSGNFSVDNLEYILPDGLLNGKIVYKNILWDKDGSGKDCFGFAQARDFFVIARRLTSPSCTDEKAGKVRIEVVSGTAPFQYSLTNGEAKIARQWRQSERQMEQKDLVAGHYILTVADAKETIKRGFSLVMPDALLIDLGPDQHLSLDKEIVLDVSSQIPDTVRVSYRWQNSFGFESTDRKIKAIESGIYQVFVTKEKDGCVFSDVVAVSGSEVNRVAVYPNILNMNDYYNTSISLANPGPVSVKVFNAGGNLLYDLNGSNQTEYQFITTLKDPGVFLVVIQTPTGIETRKVVVY